MSERKKEAIGENYENEKDDLQLLYGGHGMDKTMIMIAWEWIEAVNEYGEYDEAETFILEVAFEASGARKSASISERGT